MKTLHEVGPTQTEEHLLIAMGIRYEMGYNEFRVRDGLLEYRDKTDQGRDYGWFVAREDRAYFAERGVTAAQRHPEYRETTRAQFLP